PPVALLLRNEAINGTRRTRGNRSLKRPPSVPNLDSRASYFFSMRARSETSAVLVAAAEKMLALMLSAFPLNSPGCAVSAASRSNHHWLPRVQKKPPLQLATASNPLLGSRLTPLTVTLAATALLVPERSVTLTSTSRTTLLFPLAMVPLMGVPEWSIEAFS